MFGKFTRPKTKSVVVFGGYDNPLHPSLLCYLSPLTCVQCGWVKLCWFFISITPFHIRKGVHVKMNKGIVFQFLPSQLMFIGNRSNRFYSTHRNRNTGDAQGYQNEDEEGRLPILFFHAYCLLNFGSINSHSRMWGCRCAIRCKESIF